jgi:creatinine amidohydrolase
MIEWINLTSDEVPGVDKRLPVIIPIGLIEAHGPHLPLSVDMDSAAYFSRRVAQESGAILAPLLAYGFADEMREYPGTVGLKASTLARVIVDISSMFCFHGFTRQIFLSGHGANKMPVETALFEIWESYPALKAVYWNYWTEAGITSIHHADKGETEIAMSIGTPAKMDKVRDFNVRKPWYKIRSRFELDPASGGINGKPSAADPAEGERMREEIVRVLTGKVATIIAAERGGA